MIKHLEPAAKKTLLELFNELWKNGAVLALRKKTPSSQSIKEIKTRKTQIVTAPSASQVALEYF